MPRKSKASTAKQAESHSVDCENALKSFREAHRQQPTPPALVQGREEMLEHMWRLYHAEFQKASRAEFEARVTGAPPAPSGRSLDV